MNSLISVEVRLVFCEHNDRFRARDSVVQGFVAFIFIAPILVTTDFKIFVLTFPGQRVGGGGKVPTPTPPHLPGSTKQNKYSWLHHLLDTGVWFLWTIPTPAYAIVL